MGIMAAGRYFTLSDNIECASMVAVAVVAPFPAISLVHDATSHSI